MVEHIDLPEGTNEEKFKELFESFIRKFEGLKTPETRGEAISALTREITDQFEYWLPPAFNQEAMFEVEGEIGTLLEQIVSYLLGEET